MKSGHAHVMSSDNEAHSLVAQQLIKMLYQSQQKTTYLNRMYSGVVSDNNGSADLWNQWQQTQSLSKECALHIT